MKKKKNNKKKEKKCTCTTTVVHMVHHKYVLGSSVGWTVSGPCRLLLGSSSSLSLLLVHGALDSTRLTLD